MIKVDTRKKRILLFLCFFAYLAFVAVGRMRMKGDPTAVVLLAGVGILVIIFLYPSGKETKPTRAEERRLRKEERRRKKQQLIHALWRRPWR